MTASNAKGASATPSTEFERRRAEIREIVRRHGGINPRVFGSVARGEAQASSDLDLLVDHARERSLSLFDLATIGFEIEDLIGAPVQVLTPASLAPHVLAAADRDARPV